MGRAQLAEPHRHAPLLAVREFEDDSQQPPPSTLQAPLNDERTTRRRSALNRSLLYFRLSTAPCATLPPAGYPRPMWRRPLQSQTWLDGLRPDVRASSRPSAPRWRTDARLVERAVPPCLSATRAKRARMVARSPARRESGTNERRHSPRHIGPHRAGGTRCGTMRPPVPTCAPGAKRLPVVPRPERSRPTKPNIGGNDKRKRARYDKEPVWGQRGAAQASNSRSHSSPVITPSDASFFAIARPAGGEREATRRPGAPRLGAGDGRRGAPGAEHPGALGDPGTGRGRGRSGLAEQVSTGGAGRTFGGVHGRLRALGCRPV